MKANSRTQTFLRELRLPRAERAARREARRVEDHQMRRTRENHRAPERRAAAAEAEARKYQGAQIGSPGPLGGPAS